MRLVHYNKEGTEADLTSMVLKCSWSGDYREAARKLDVTLLASATDKNLPPAQIQPADMLFWYGDDGSELWRGYVFRKSKSLTGNALEVTAYDGLIYLIKSEFSKVFMSVTAEQVAAAVCSELGVPGGTFAATDIPQSFPHLSKTGYQAIMTAYTTASRQNGKEYLPRMAEGALDVIEKGVQVGKRVILSDQHVTDSTYSEDIEDMVNAVQITDEKGNVIGTVSRPDWVQTYGLLQRSYQQEKGKDAQTAARKLLKDLNQEASLELVGGVDTYDLITGHAVQVREAYTGLTGLFYIDGDTHTWESGQHTIRLTLSFKNVMDEQEADEFDKDDDSKVSYTMELDY
ncbi:XkdQ/YqbQ family protein [Gorillibacterium sp. sgz5001074]|uniref:XkdQ/YqbQ family protein n=1 Tax=Gorillibacterium sp. sgz5001074 TaxID=3446695 RepID=UPI003F67B93D